MLDEIVMERLHHLFMDVGGDGGVILKLVLSRDNNVMNWAFMISMYRCTKLSLRKGMNAML